MVAMWYAVVMVSSFGILQQVPTRYLLLVYCCLKLSCNCIKNIFVFELMSIKWTCDFMVWARYCQFAGVVRDLFVHLI